MDSQYTLEVGTERDLEREQPTIRVIAGGPTLAGDLNKVRKNYGRYALTSKDVFFNLPIAKRENVRQVPIIYPHDDALVIKVTLAGKEFQRILGDIGK